MLFSWNVNIIYGITKINVEISLIAAGNGLVPSGTKQ